MDLTATEQGMTQAVHAFERDLERVRTGGASASMLEDIRVDHHGRRARLLDVASVTIPDPRQIVIRPWDPASLRAIGSAISGSRSGLTPTLDGPVIRVFVPAMTGERRRELADLVQRRREAAHVEIRTLRHVALAALRRRDLERAVGSDEIRRRTATLQALTARAIAEVDRLALEKAERLLRA